VERLAELDPAERYPALPPVLDRDPYLSAWINVKAALGNATDADQDRMTALLTELDARLNALDMPSSFREASRRAVRALLARRWLLTEESLAFVYEPFESSIPLDSLNE
jgi:hypothetical protein